MKKYRFTKDFRLDLDRFRKLEFCKGEIICGPLLLYDNGKPDAIEFAPNENIPMSVLEEVKPDEADGYTDKELLEIGYDNAMTTQTFLALCNFIEAVRSGRKVEVGVITDPFKNDTNNRLLCKLMDEIKELLDENKKQKRLLKVYEDEKL